MQNEYNKGVSLRVQEQLCFKFASENKLRVKSVHKEIHSAFHKTPKILNDVIKKKNQNIIIASVDRFSRSCDIGLKMAAKCIKNKNKLIFIQEKFIISDSSSLITLNQFLKNTERESSVISTRIKKAKNFLLSNNMFAGGSIPYGYKVIDKKLVKDNTEQSIIEFIKICMKDSIPCDLLNRKMIDIACISPYVPIYCYNKSGTVIKILTEPLSKHEISDLLNSYKIKKRGILWCPRVLKTAIKPYDPKVDLGDSTQRMCDWNELANEIENIHLNEIKVRPNNIGISFDSKTKISKKHNGKKLRRSTRLNSELNTDSDMSVESIDIDTDTDMKHEVQLFKKFTEFQKFRKLYK
jgi:DNA invertase Pin-like site-specific DNA recombinase